VAGKTVVAANPCFCELAGQSYWTYKFTTDCEQNTKGISSIAILVCETILAEHVVVEELIDGCDTFSVVPFTLSKTDPIYGTAPAGFQILKVETADRFDVGVTVVYRVQIKGNFPVTSQPVKVKAGPKVLTFDCEEDCYLVPACPAVGKLLVVKECSEVIVDNKVTLFYSVDVTNIGNAPLSAVSYNEQVIYDPANLTIGPVTVDPPTLSVDTTPGRIIISGNLGAIDPGGLVRVTYQVPILTFAVPGFYLITSNTVATAPETEAMASCVLNLDAVQLTADKCCAVDGNRGVFRITIASVGASPQTEVAFLESVFVPAGVTVQFTDFDGCVATFPDGSPVPLNTNLTNTIVNVWCPSLTVPAGGSAQKNIRFLAVTTVIQPTEAIVNTLVEVDFLNGDEQIFLGIAPVPVSASVAVTGSMECLKPCALAAASAPAAIEIGSDLKNSKTLTDKE
jgi:hypothetical protein